MEVELPNKNGVVHKHRVRLLTYLPGQVLASASVQNSRLLESAGRIAGQMTKLLAVSQSVASKGSC